jgi:DNA end-binding protein Ku
VPSGKVAQKPYAVLQQVMAERDRHGVARVILSGRENLAILRAVDGLLVMTLLNFDEDVKKPAEFLDEVADVTISSQEHDLAESLVDASTTEKFDFGEYKDEYGAALAKMLESKAAGKRTAKGQKHEEPVIVNLMDALRQSLARTQKSNRAKPVAAGRASTPKKKPPARAKRTAPKRKKTG